MNIKIEREEDGREGRFVIYENDVFAGEMTYQWAGTSKVIIDLTGVENAFGGKGYGKMLVMSAVDFARANNIKIMPLCPFAKAQFEKDASIQDVKF